jgi:hypothetical protein
VERPFARRSQTQKEKSMAQFARCSTSDGSAEFYINVEQITFMRRDCNGQATGIRFAVDKDFVLSVPETPEEILTSRPD